MKKTFLIIVVMITTNVFISQKISAQTPEKMSYQAIIRDASETLISNSLIGMQISVLKGSAVGTAVYVESQAPTTNTNGLVSLEIGTGNVITGTFALIDWANDIYFIKIETDPMGGTNYTITGTSQLMSQPYAFHAKTATSITGGIIESDPIYGASTANGIIASDISNWNNKLSTEVDGSITNEIQSLADVAAINNSVNTQLKNVTNPTDTQDAVTKSYVDLLETRLDLLEARIFALEPIQIGDFRNGGIVFYIDGTREHGLVCTVSELSTGAEWGCTGTLITGADGTAIGTGAQNTLDIEAECVTVGTAADLCVNLSLNGFSDWFLPSKDELNEMFLNRTVIDVTAVANGGNIFFTGFTDGNYWTSTEFLAGNSWIQNFGNSNQGASGKATPYNVRAVRVF